MEVDGMDLVALLEGSPAPQPENFDDLFSDADLLQFLNVPEPCEPSSLQTHAAPATCAAPVAVPSTSSNSSQSEAPSPVLPPAPMLPSAPLAALQLPPAAAACGLERLVTTTAAQQVWAAMLQAAYRAPPAAPCLDEAKLRTMQPAGNSRQGSRDSSADSSDTDEDMQDDSKAGNKSGNKRKAPEVDWRQIEDPAERRRQRRLAKNRVTAARSRERKKAMWSELEEKLKSMENENAQLRAMLEQFARENSSLKTQLLNITRASAASGAAGLCQARAGTTMDPAAILPVFIVTLLVVCSLLPGDKACALLGSVLPLALVASMLGGAEGASPSSSSVDSSASSGSAGASASQCGAGAAFDCLFRLLHMLGTLLTGSGRVLQRSMKRLLFGRHRYLGRRELRKLAAVDVDALLRNGGAGGGGSGGSGRGGAGGEVAGCLDGAVSGALPAVLPCWKAEGLATQAAIKLEPVC